METFDPRQLPFINRKMLSFDHGTTFAVEIKLVGHESHIYHMRGMTQAGFFTQSFQIAGDGSIETFVFPITDIPVSVSLLADEDSNPEAIGYAVLHLIANGNRIALLAQGIVNGLFGVAWPWQSPTTETQIKGGFFAPTLTTPAVGQEFTLTVPQNQIWEIHGLTLRLFASAAVANRTVAMHVILPDNSIDRKVAGTVQTASQTISYYFIPGGTNQVVVANSEQEVGLRSSIILPPGSIMRTDTANLQAGDQWSGDAGTVRITYIAT